MCIKREKKKKQMLANNVVYRTDLGCRADVPAALLFQNKSDLFVTDTEGGMRCLCLDTFLLSVLKVGFLSSTEGFFIRTEVVFPSHCQKRNAHRK